MEHTVFASGTNAAERISWGALGQLLLVAELYGHGRVAFAERLQREQAVTIGFSLSEECSGLDAVVPTPAGVAHVAGHEHRTGRCAGDEGDVSGGVSWTEDREVCAVAEDVDHPFERSIGVLGDLELLERWPSLEEPVVRSLREQVQEERCLGLVRADVDRDVLRNVREPGDVVEMDVGQEDPGQRRPRPR
jgi:hypothetical protein